jgi:hypothetical protein
MSDEEFSSADNARRKRLKIWALVASGVSGVAGAGLTAALWGQGAGWGRTVRHGWQDLFSLVLVCSTASLLITAQRLDRKAAPSPLSTLDLSQHTEGEVKPARSDHWSDETSSEAR